MKKDIDYKKLRDIRRDKNLTQKEIAAKLNVVPSAYNKIERGERDLRLGQLRIIADTLGKDIKDFILVEKNNTRNDSSDAIKKVEILEKIFCMLGAEVEEKLFQTFHIYESKYEFQILSFEEYLNDPYDNPATAVSMIKSDIESYEKGEKYVLLGKRRIKKFIGQDDKWLMDFVTRKKNYEIIFMLLSGPIYYKFEDSYNAFKDLLKEEPLMHTLFTYGLLENSTYKKYWDKYQEETKAHSAKISLGQKTVVSKHISEIMKDIFNRHNKRLILLSEKKSANK